MIDEYEENSGRTLAGAEGDEHNQLLDKYNEFGHDRFTGSGQFWNGEGFQNGRLENVILEIPNDVMQKMFPGKSPKQWLVILQSGEYDDDGNPIMETITEHTGRGNETREIQRPKKTLWRLEYDYRYRTTAGVRVCDEELWSQIWGKMQSGLLDQVRNGGFVEEIVAAHEENLSRSPAYKNLGAKVGKESYQSTDEDTGEESLSFDIICETEYDDNFYNDYSDDAGDDELSLPEDMSIDDDFQVRR